MAGKGHLANLKPWKKGQSGNPSGRPKGSTEIVELARSKSPEAVRTLVAIMADKEAPPPARVSAANSILDRGYGKPPQSVTVHRKNEVADLDDSELDQRIVNALDRIEGLASRANGKANGAKDPDTVH